MDSLLPFPGPVDGAGGGAEPHAAEKSVIRIQERRIVSMIVRLPFSGPPGSIRAWSSVTVRANRVLPFVVLAFAAVAAVQPIDAQSSLRSRVYATGLSSPVALDQVPTRI